MSEEEDIHSIREGLNKLTGDFAKWREDRDRQQALDMEVKRGWAKWMRAGVVSLIVAIFALGSAWGVLQWRVNHMEPRLDGMVTRLELSEKLDALVRMHEYRHAVLLEKLAEVKASADRVDP